MTRFVTPSTPCPSCAGPTVVTTGSISSTGYRRYRLCKECGCKFTATQERGATVEKIGIILVKGNATQAATEPDDPDEAEPIEPEPGAEWGSVEQMRRALVLSIYSDKLVMGRGEFDRETLALRDMLQQKKLRKAA